MSKPRYFSFKTTLERGDRDETVEVEAMIESYAASVGFGSEPCSQQEVSIVSVLHDGPKLSSDEMNELQERACDKSRHE